MNLKETELEIASTRELMTKLYYDWKKTKDRNSELIDQKQQLLFTKVLECIKVGDVITFNRRVSNRILNLDRVEVIRKNKKSVTIKYLHRASAWAHPKVGENFRILAPIFGKAVYHYSTKSDAIKRDDRLKDLLG